MSQPEQVDTTESMRRLPARGVQTRRTARRQVDGDHLPARSRMRGDGAQQLRGHLGPLRPRREGREAFSQVNKKSARRVGDKTYLRIGIVHLDYPGERAL